MAVKLTAGADPAKVLRELDNPKASKGRRFQPAGWRFGCAKPPSPSCIAAWTEEINMLVTEWNMETALEVREEEGFERGVKIGEKRGVEIGFNRGRNEGMEKAARNALAKGYTPEQVRDITGLDLEAIERLRNR